MAPTAGPRRDRRPTPPRPDGDGAPPPSRDWNAIRLIIGKDLRAVRRSKAIVLPMIIVPAVLLILLPVAAGAVRPLGPHRARCRARSARRCCTGMAEPIVSLPEREQIVVLVLGYLLSPLLLVIPLMVSAVLAADAFAGEKERRTLEGLLLLPISDRDLFLAKVLSAYVPGAGHHLGRGRSCTPCWAT